MPEFVERTEIERAAKGVLDIFLMPDQLNHPVRQMASDKLAHHHSYLAAPDKALLYTQTKRDPELGAIFAQSVIAKNKELLGVPEVRKLVLKEIPKMKDSLGQGELLFQLTKQKLDRREASFVVKNVLDYLETEIRDVPIGRRFFHDGSLDLRFFALERTAEFHTDGDKRRLAEAARADFRVGEHLQTMTARAPSAERRQNVPEAHAEAADHPHSGNDSGAEGRLPGRHYEERTRDRLQGR